MLTEISTWLHGSNFTELHALVPI